MAFLVATTSLPAVYRPNGYARTTTAGTPHACARMFHGHCFVQFFLSKLHSAEVGTKFLFFCMVSGIWRHNSRVSTKGTLENWKIQFSAISKIWTYLNQIVPWLYKLFR